MARKNEVDIRTRRLVIEYATNCLRLEMCVPEFDYADILAAWQIGEPEVRGIMDIDASREAGAVVLVVVDLRCVVKISVKQEEV